VTEPAAAAACAAVPGIPRDADGPVFAEPWEAQAVALADEIRRAGEAGDPDTGGTYYRHWLAALERLVAEKAVTDAATLGRYADAWGRAADRTPHGTPIELRASDFT
jgi:nitrile hydratase accessory protein